MSKFVLVPGTGRWVDAAREALALDSVDAVAADDPPEIRRLAAEPDTLGILIDLPHRAFEEIAGALQETAAAENAAVLAVARDPLRDDLRRAFRLGASDYLAAGSIHRIRDFARVLGRGDPWAGVRAPAGRAVLAHPDRKRRGLIGRVLRQWGFDLVFAQDQDELAAQISKEPPPRVVIADADLGPNGAIEALRRARGKGSSSPEPWLLLLDSTGFASTRAATKAFAPVGMYDRTGPAENVIFAVNDLLQTRGAELRRSPRLLYGGPVAFWSEADPELVWAYAYNVSRSGLYVRTMVPPPMNAVLHIRFRPPHGEGMLAMDAQVMWRKERGSQAGPMYPAGIGIQFVRRPLADDAAMVAGYEQLLRDNGLAADGSESPHERATVQVDEPK